MCYAILGEIIKMEEYRLVLDKNIGSHWKIKIACPRCLRKKRFTRYIDTYTFEYLGDDIGICDRINECGYHLPPSGNMNLNREALPPNVKPFIQKYIDQDILKASLTYYENNNLFQWLQFTGEADKLCRRFSIGTSSDGRTVFWPINKYGKICQPKLIKYKPDGHRDKGLSPTVPKGFSMDSGYKPCLFGEQYLDKDKTVMLVESEKTVLIGHCFHPEYTWVATGGANGFTVEKASVLKGYKVVVLLDGDEAGQKGAARTIERLKSFNIKCVNVTLFPDSDKDIADYYYDLDSLKVDAPNIIELHPALQSLQAKNPLVKDLVERLGLEVVNISKH